MLTIRQPEPKESRDTWLGPAPWIVTPPPGPQAVAAVSRDVRVTSPSYDRPYPLVVRRARGSIVEDVDGNRYLDFTAGVGACSAGHCHPLVVKAIEQQSRELLHMGGSSFYYEPMIRLAEKLTSLAPGAHAKQVHFTNGGLEAIHAASQLARSHTGRGWIIGFGGGLFESATGGSAQRVVLACYGEFQAIEQLLEDQVPASDIAAIFVEPFLVRSGQAGASAEYLRQLRELCDQHGILLVADETQTGIGRSGTMLACEQTGVVPDVLCIAGGLAGGMPLGAVVAPEGARAGADATGPSFILGGNPVSCAAALATIEVVDGQYAANAAALGQTALGRLERLAGKYRCIGHVRGVGLMLGIDIVGNRRRKTPASDLRDRIVQEAFVRGLLLFGGGPSTIRITPPLCINQTQLEVGLDVLDEVIATVAG